MEKLLRITTAFPEQLQDSGMILLRAVNLVKAARDNLQAARSDTASCETFETAKKFAARVGFELDLTATAQGTMAVDLHVSSTCQNC